MISRINRLRAKKGFTMVELIVVIAIIGILTAMLVPALTYDNKPTVGKGMAKDFFYKAQDALTSAEVAYPKAISTGETVTFFADVNDSGVITGSGAMTKTAAEGGGYTLSLTYFPASFTIKHDGTAADDKNGMYKVMRDEFENYIASSENMAGRFYIMVDDGFRARIAYWSDATDFGNGGGDFVENCILGNGFYACSYPTSRCETGEILFPTIAT